MPQDRNARCRVEKACVEWKSDLGAFLLGVLKDRHLAEDALQRTMVRALQSAESAGAETLRGWMFRIALNEARQMRRSQRREQSRVQAAGAEALLRWPGGPSGPVELSAGETGVVRQELTEAIGEALSRLPDDYRDVVQKRIFDGLSFAEIAEVRSLPLGIVLTWMRRGMLRLKEDRKLKELL